MDRLRAWWNSLLRRRATSDASTTRSGIDEVRPRTNAATPVHQAKPGLALTESPKKATPKRVGAAGFDPYGNDGGYSKPHGWDRGDHR